MDAQRGKSAQETADTREFDEKAEFLRTSDNEESSPRLSQKR